MSTTTPAIATVPYDELESALRGELITPADPRYDEARAVYNAMVDKRPAAIARVRDAVDVMTAVRYARQHGHTIAVRGGGHNAAGLGVWDGALVIDLSRMRSTTVDPRGHTVRVDGGCEIASQIGHQHEGHRNLVRAKPGQPSLRDRVTAEPGDLVQEGTRPERHERHLQLFQPVFGEPLVPKMRDTWRLVAGEDAGEHESADGGAGGSVGKIGVAGDVNCGRVSLAVPGVSGRRGDYGVRPLHAAD